MPRTLHHRLHVHRTTLLAALLPLASPLKPCQGADLPQDAPVRIGVKRRPELCAREAKPGDTLILHYVGRLYSTCDIFDSSRERGEPFEFVLGQEEVIRGWDEGLRGMCPGEVRKLTIPSDLGYGDTGSGEAIPGGATLVFEVELLHAHKAKRRPPPPPPKKKKISKELRDAMKASDQLAAYSRMGKKTKKAKRRRKTKPSLTLDIGGLQQDVDDDDEEEEDDGPELVSLDAGGAPLKDET